MRPLNLTRFLYLIWLVAALVTRAEPPGVEAIFPAGGARGSTNLVAVTGKLDPWPPKVSITPPGLTFESQTNKGRFSVTIAADAPAGPRLIRFFNEEGASDPRIFVVGDGPEAAEVEENNRFSKPQWIDHLPVTINGRLDKRDDVDCYGIRLRAGEWLDAAVDSYTLMSKVDGVLRLVTTNGQQIAWNHDFITLDPRLVWQAPHDQPVILQVFGFPHPADAEIRLTGGDACVYRLHLAVMPEAPVDHSNLEFPTPDREIEPNNTPVEAMPWKLPMAVAGTISTPDDEDRFRFAVETNQVVAVEVRAASGGSPLDAWLKIENEAGSEVARNDDNDGSMDPRLEWKTPAGGNFILAVGSVTHRGSEQFRYRISATPVYPDFRAFLSASSLVITQGMTNEFKMNFKRLRGFTNELVASAADLPPGLTLLPAKLEGKESGASLRFAAADEAPPFQGPVRIFLGAPGNHEGRAVPFSLTSRSENNGVPGGYTRLLVEETDLLWVTVRLKPPEKPPTAPHGL